MIESAFALMVAFLINVSVISVSGAVCNSSNLNAEDRMSCQDLDLNEASFLLRVCEIWRCLSYLGYIVVLSLVTDSSKFTLSLSFIYNGYSL